MASDESFTNWFCEGRLAATSSANDRFVLRNRPEPLSPLWEAFIDGYWRPWCQQFLAAPQHQDIEADLREKMSRNVQYHAFNMSNPDLNISRANVFAAALMTALIDCHAPRSTPDPWWPQDGIAMLEAIKQERREIDSLGYVRSADSRRSEEQVSDNKDIEAQ